MLIFIMSLICLVNEGDSITGGAFATYTCYPWAAAGLGVSDVPGYATFASSAPQGFVFSNNGVICLNRAIAGSRLQASLVPRASAWVDALIPATQAPRFQTGLKDNRPTRKYILSLMIGTNNDTTDPAVHASNVATYIAARRSAGFNNIILCTIPSRTDGIIGTAHSTTFDTTYAQPYNALVRAGIAGVDQVCDFASNSNIGGTGAAENATYFVDNIHPTKAGYDIMTPIYSAAVSSLIATL